MDQEVVPLQPFPTYAAELQADGEIKTLSSEETRQLIEETRKGIYEWIEWCRANERK